MRTRVFDYDYFDTPDINGKDRIGIKFFFKRTGVYHPVSREQFQTSIADEDEMKYGNYIYPNVSERKGLVTSRVGQGAYRKRIIHPAELIIKIYNKLNAV